MTVFESHRPNTFCWADLSTTDIAAAKDFYTQLFGWSVTEIPIGEGMVYTIFQCQGKDVCGGAQMEEQMLQQGIPPHWMTSLSVADIEQSCLKITELGGLVLQPPFPVMESGVMGIVKDPQGAVLSLWEAKESIGSQIMYEPNTLCWNELQTHDIESASAFYQGLCGWTTKLGSAATGGDYFEFQSQDTSLAGMIQIRPEWGPVPPNWSIYFMVEDCNRVIQQVESLGGEVVMPATNFDMGQLAVFKDPQGAVFSVFQFANQN